MFRYICSYQQMSPILVDMLASFGSQYRRSGFDFASFSQDDLTKPVRPSQLQIDEIGRSDWELRHCYKLNGIELSDHDDKWTMRQAVVYHSFDMNNGRAFWLTIKANDELRDRVVDGCQSLESMRAQNLNTLGSSFESCLANHMICLDWCAEGWRWYISKVESQISEIFHKVKSYPLDPAAGELDPTQQLARSLSMPPANGGGFSMPSTQGMGHIQNGPIQAYSTLKTKLSNKIRGKDIIISEPEQVVLDKRPRQLETNRERYQTISKRLDMMKIFSFSEFQKLNDVASKLKEAKLAMALNVGVLRDLRGYYQAHYDSSTLPSEITDVCSSTGSFEQFMQRTKSLEKGLESECMRAEALVALVQDGITLVRKVAHQPTSISTGVTNNHLQYNSILQSYNTEVSRVFALSGHETSQRMEDSAMRMEAVTDSMYDIARQTARDSASMHVITFFTLVFLPGTFLGVRLMMASYLKSPTGSLTSDQTFFSTPILSTPEAANPQSWNVNNGLLSLFFEICIPMMFVTVIAWYLYLNKRWFRRNPVGSGQEDIEASAGRHAGS